MQNTKHFQFILMMSEGSRVRSQSVRRFLVKTKKKWRFHGFLPLANMDMYSMFKKNVMEMRWSDTNHGKFLGRSVWTILHFVWLENKEKFL